MKKNVTLICDLQFGSTGKGACVGYLAKKEKPDTVVTAWMPNCGHTFIDENGKKFVHCMLANGIVSPSLQRVMIAPGSILDLGRLKMELEQCEDLVTGKKLVIHQNAAVVDQKHRDLENKTMDCIGSTKKGCGAALIQKIQRQVDDIIIAKDHKSKIIWVLPSFIEIEIVDTARWIDHLNSSDSILVEGAQGFSLGINSGFWPFTTSRECSPAQIMSDTLISKNRIDKVVGVMRTYPIRVANRYDADGNQIGYSGPGYSDQKETTWETIGQKPEITTVTKLQRRVFTFSMEQTRQALNICAPDEIYLSFCDYCTDSEINLRRKQIDEMCKDILGNGNVVKYMSYGPKITDVKEVHKDSEPEKYTVDLNKNDVITLEDIQKRVVTWADKTLPDRTLANTFMKLIVEISELIEGGLKDPKEYADLIILAVDMAHLAGIKDITKAVLEKMDINEKRNWAYDDVSGTYSHYGSRYTPFDQEDDGNID